jgi:hypothetical protein
MNILFKESSFRTQLSAGGKLELSPTSSSNSIFTRRGSGTLMMRRLGSVVMCWVDWRISRDGPVVMYWVNRGIDRDRPIVMRRFGSVVMRWVDRRIGRD